jgi:DNA-binding GntR family transcriptional regulator
MPSESAQDLCLAHLRDAILSGRLPPGTRIRPEAVAAELGVSRMPVREALHQLDAEGLVTLRPNRGAVVTRLGPEDLAEIFEMRALLEGLCARHAARRATPAEIEELDLEAQAMRRLAAEPEHWLDRHEAFHDRLCALSARPRAAAEARRLRLLMRPLLRAHAGSVRDPETLGHEHEVIVDALRDRDARRAERLAVAHVNANAETVLAGLRRAPRAPASAR